MTKKSTRVNGVTLSWDEYEGRDGNTYYDCIELKTDEDVCLIGGCGCCGSPWTDDIEQLKAMLR